MKKCPYCDYLFPEDQKVCPKCGSPYWKPEDDKELKKIYKESEEEKNGCLSLLFMPVTVSLMITAFMILAGFITNILIHFKNNQIKFIWIGLSVLGGLIAYKFFSKKQKIKRKNKEL
ncbi:MAG: hypothetical protein ACOC5G_00355 [Acidobacteriota bacterium]